MPVKKTTTKKPVAKKTTTTHKTTAAKTVEHKATKAPTHVHHDATAKHAAVVVETKKTNKHDDCSVKWKSCMKKLFVLLLLLNLVFGVLNFMKQDSSLKLEEMKVGWPANFEKVMKLYNSDFYKEQQGSAIQQFMAQSEQQ